VPFLPANQQHQSTEGTSCISNTNSVLHMSSNVDVVVYVCISWGGPGMGMRGGGGRGGFPGGRGRGMGGSMMSFGGGGYGGQGTLQSVIELTSCPTQHTIRLIT